jgi:hypothetical protein
MEDYFAHSQKIRKDIETSPSLIDTLKKHFSKNEEAELISRGSQHSIYRIGQLENGLWVAFRHNHHAGKKRITTNGTLSVYESYAQKAEEYSKEGKRVSEFCVGIENRGDIGLLVEDFTEGRKRKLEIANLDELFADNPRELIYIDIDDDYADLDYFKYMNKENRIVL